MINRIFNRNTALGLTLAALVSELWRGFLDAMFVLPVDFGEPATLHAASLIFTALFFGWGLALAFAWQGSRLGLIVTFALNALVLVAVPIGWLAFYCTGTCQMEAGIFNLANSLNLVLGSLAAIISIGYFFRTRASVQIQPERGV